MRTWGDGYGYLLVATGRIEAMVDPAANFWDIAPCQVVIDEAGGRWSSLDGSSDPHRGDFIATNGHVHDAVLEILAGRLG
jgi:fructose-1,6-bisphosphatase/inositol monophosphatase family enzyme